MILRLVLTVTMALLTACSEVGPGLKNHPLDCAMGIAWADCLPGTAGYERGGGSKTRADALAGEQAALQTQAEHGTSNQTRHLDLRSDPRRFVQRYPQVVRSSVSSLRLSCIHRPPCRRTAPKTSQP